MNIEMLESVEYQKYNLKLLKASFINQLNEMLEHNNLGYEIVNDITATKQSDFLHIEAVCKPLTLLKNEEFNGALMEYIEVPIAKPKKKSIALTVEQQEMFLEYSKDNYLYPFFRVALMSGLRNGELRALRWCDINLCERRLYVYNTLIWKDKEGYFLDLVQKVRSVRFP